MNLQKAVDLFTVTKEIIKENSKVNSKLNENEMAR